MGVPLGRLVDVQVKEPRPLDGMADRQARLLLRLPQCGVPGALTGVDVPTRLHPAVQALVLMENGAPGTDHDSGTGHVNGVGLLVEWPGQEIEALEDPEPGLAFPGINRGMAGDGVVDHPQQPGRPAAVPTLLPAASRHGCHR